MSPLVSIIVPCYNQEEFIGDALQSVYDQSYTNWECIVMDDGSTDSSKKIVQQWVIKDTRFHYHHKTNGGVSETRNHAIQYAGGEFILPLDGDDMLAKDYLQKAIEIFSNDPDTKLVYCDPIMFGAKNGVVNSRDYSFKMLLMDNTIPCTGIFRKVDFEQTKGYNTNMIYGLEDWDFWVSFLNKEDIVVKLKENLVYYRIKELSRSTIIKEQEDKNEAMLLQIFINNENKYLKYFNPIRNKIEADFYKEESSKLLDSMEYAVGKTICFPIALIKKVWRKITR